MVKNWKSYRWRKVCHSAQLMLPSFYNSALYIPVVWYTHHRWSLYLYFLLQDRLGPLPTTTAGFNTAVSAAVAAAAASRDLSAIVPTTTHGFFTNFHNSTQQQHVTPPSTPGLVSVAAPSTVSNHEPLFTISDHFVNSSTTSASGNSFQLSTVNGNINHALTTIQGRKMNENSLVVRQIYFW